MSQKLISYTPVLETGALASGDVMSVAAEVAGVALDPGGCALLKSIVLSDNANQKQSLDILFFDSQPANSLGALNAAYALVDADSAKLLGRISVITTDYVSSGSNNAEVTVKNIDLMLKAASRSKSIYIAIVCRSGTPTYAASSIVMRLGIEQ